MSMKRVATTELNHDNWDEKEPEEHKEIGVFKTAPKEVLEKRVIKTAKRRTQASSDEPKKSVFSGFGGFNKTQTSSFNFLANLTNGTTNNNDITTKNETSITSSLFTYKPAQSSPGGSSETPVTPFKTVFEKKSSPAPSLFGTFNATNSSVFKSKAADLTVNDTPFKIPPVPGLVNNSNADITKVTTVTTIVTTPKETSSIFGTIHTTPNNLVSSTSNSSPFKTKSTVDTTLDDNKEKTVVSFSDTEEQQSKKSDEEKKHIYYSKLKGLNESVSDWIKKHVEKTPLCILSPIFRDYERYLKEIKAEYENPNEKATNDNTSDKSTPKITTNTENTNLFGADTLTTGNNNTKAAELSMFKTENSKPSLFAPDVKNLPEPKMSGFRFGIQNTSTSIPSVAVTTTAGFSFGFKASTQSNKTSSTIHSNTTTSLSSTPFSFTTNTTTTASSTAPFSFGIGKPFSFGSNINNKVENTETKKDVYEEQNDEDQPPKVDYTPIVEENSIFDKRCKLFIKKDDNFIDKGVGTLYIKKINDCDKYQLLVRANTNLGNILLNLRLSSSIPTQKMGKNNVMIICIPTPDSKPPPTPILIRVKTSEEADELLDVLNKYKT